MKHVKRLYCERRVAGSLPVASERFPVRFPVRGLAAEAVIASLWLLKTSLLQWPCSFCIY